VNFRNYGILRWAMMRVVLSVKLVGAQVIYLGGCGNSGPFDLIQMAPFCKEVFGSFSWAYTSDAKWARVTIVDGV
jgi:hypothetical protein